MGWVCLTAGNCVTGNHKKKAGSPKVFADSPFILAIVISGIIAAVLMLALWLGLERSIARRLVLGAIIPAVAVAVPPRSVCPKQHAVVSGRRF